MKLPLSASTRVAVREALSEDDFETAVEVVFAEHRDATRDDVVDTIQAEEQS